MKILKAASLVVIPCLALLLTSTPAQSKADVGEQFANAMMTADIPVLEKILAPNFWYIGANGHIRDKEHLIQDIKDKTLVINRMTLSNQREETVGGLRLITSNGSFSGKSNTPLPDGIMRYTLAIVNNNGKEQVALYQSTPVIPSADCKDGNCKIK